MMPSLIKFIKSNLLTMLLLTLAGFVMSWFIWRGCCTAISSLALITIFTATLWIALWLGNAYLAQSLSYFYSWHKEPVKRLIIGLVGMTVYTIGAVKGIIYFFHYVVGFDVGDNLSSKSLPRWPIMVCDMAAKVSFETSTGPGVKSLGDGIGLGIEHRTSNAHQRASKWR